MKKTYTLLCVATTMLAACAKENIVESGNTALQDEEVKYVDVTFGAEFAVPAEEDGTKTMLDSDLSVLWCKGDEIAVNTNGIVSGKTNLYLATFSSTVNPEDAHRATFSGTVNDNATSFIAVYPAANVKLGSTWNADITSDGTVYNVLPTEQTAIAESFTNGCAISYVIGSVSNGKLTENVEFNNLCSILTFTMPNYVEGAQSVKIQSNDNIAMSGGCVITRNLSISTKMFEYKGFAASNKKDETHNYVTVTAPNTANKFYAVIFPGSYSNGFSITVTTEGGQVYSRNVSKALTAQANHIYNLGTLGVVLDEEKIDLNIDIAQDLKNGSIATFNIAAKDDFKNMVKSWDINLYNSADQLVRKIEGNTTGSGTLDIVGDYKLLAAGEYHAEVSYYMQTGSKRPATTISGIVAPQFQVDGVVVNATTSLTYDGGTLTGTDVQLSFDTSAVDSDIAALINWTEIKLTDANDVTYRTATAAGKMTPASGKPYIPNGTYTLAAYFTLPALGSTEPTPLNPKQIVVNNTPAFGVNITSAKTSYDYYKAGNVTQANQCSNMGIYELAANVTGISDAVVSQMGINYIWYLDDQNIGTSDGQGASVSGINMNTTGAKSVAFGSKNVKCQANFDTVTKDSGNIAVDITGLPYNKDKNNFYSCQNDWTFSNNGYEWANKNYVKIENKNCVVSKTFYFPENVNAEILYKIYGYTATRIKQNKTVFTAGGSTIINDSVSGTAKTTKYESTANVSFSSSNNSMSISAPNGQDTGAGNHVQVYYIGAKYRSL